MATVTISKTEYTRLKKLDQRFSGFLGYFNRISDIRTARNEIKQGKFISQEKLFKKLGF